MQNKTDSVSKGGDPASGLGLIRWLLGNWSQTTAKGTTFESWHEVSKNIFSGRGDVQAKGSDQIRLIESLLLTKMAGELFYIAKVVDNPLPVSFKLVSYSEKHATFENLEHDFPQRLDYQLEAADQLQVTVSGEADRSFTLQFSKDAPING